MATARKSKETLIQEAKDLLENNGYEVIEPLEQGDIIIDANDRNCGKLIVINRPSEEGEIKIYSVEYEEVRCYFDRSEIISEMGWNGIEIIDNIDLSPLFCN